MHPCGPLTSRLALLLGLSLVVPGVALAQSATESELAEAERQFALGLRDYEASRYEDASVRFERAYELSGAPELLYNIATVAEILRRDAEARAAYTAYLRAVPDCEDRPTIEARLRVLGDSASGVAAGSASDGEDASARSGDPATSPALEAADPATSPAAEGAPAQADVAPWALSAAGGVLLAGGAVLVGLSELDAQTVASAPTWAAAAASYERAPLLSGLGIAALGAGALALAIGIPWGATSSGSSEAGARVSVGPSSIAVTGSF